MAVCTVIVRTQRIYLCDTRHSSHEGGSHRTSRAHQIAVLIGLPHQLLGDDIHHRKAVGDNGVQLPLQTLHHDLRELLPVHLMGPVVADVPEHFIGVRDNRRAFVRPDRRDPLTHSGDFSRIGDHHLLSLVASQVFKFPQHLLGGAKIERCLVIAVLEALSSHDNPAVDLILRVEKMHVAGGADRLVEPLSQLHDLPVQIL